MSNLLALVKMARKLVQDDRELLQISQMELKKLQRQYRIMEGDKNSYAGEIKGFINKQRKIIDILLKEENSLLVKLSTDRPVSAPELSHQWEKSYTELLKTYEKYLFLMKNKKDVISKLDRKIRALESESKVISYYGDGKVIQIDANVERIEKQIELLQNKLHHEMVKYDKAFSENTATRQEVNALLKDRSKFNENYKKLVMKLNSDKKKLMLLIEKATSACEQRDEADGKLKQAMSKDFQETAAQKHKMSELHRQLDHLRELKEFISIKGQKRILVDVERKQTEKKRETVANVESFISKHDRILTQIKEFCEEPNTDRLPALFIKQEEENFALFNYVNEINNEVENLQDEVQILIKSFEEQKHSSTFSRTEQNESFDSWKTELEGKKQLVEKERDEISSTLPEGVPAELTVSELEEMACRQQQQIESQRQLLAAKEQRLRFLKQHEAKHQLVATEHERLRRLRDKVETQEQKLRKLRALRGQVDQTKLNNVSLTSDLESIRALFNEKEKELSIAVAKVEELTRQLEELQRGRDSNSNQVAPSVAAVELEKLRSELLYRNKLNEQHSARLTHQRELLAQRQEEMAAIDRRIGELQERLHRKRMLNQQLVHHVNNKPQNQDNNQKFTPQQTYQQSLSQNQSLQKSLQFHQQQQQVQQKQHQQKLHQMQQIQMQKQQLQQQQMQMQMQTSPSGFNNLSAISKTMQLKSSNNTNTTSQGVGPMTKNLPKTSTGTNIAAVEPYHHVPSVKSSHQSPVGGVTSALDNKRSFRKSDQLDAAPPSNQRIVYPSHPLTCQKELKSQPVTEDRLPSTYPSPAGPSLNSSISVSVEDKTKPEESSVGNDSSSTNRVGEFWPNKFDLKYQTLPTSGIARYNLTRYDYRRPAEGIESSVTTNVPESNQKFNSNDKRLSNDGYSNVNNSNNNHIQNSNTVKESAEMNEANQHDNSSNCGADILAKNSSNNTANASQQQPSHMQPMNIVRSMPIQTTTNKGLATPLSNSNYVPRCTATNINNFSRSYDTPAYSGYNHSSENHSVASVITCSSTVVTYTSTYQKPVSSVSPIYQTSSTRIQPVQPQIIGSFSVAYNQQSQDARKSYLQNDASINNYSKPALPPKPAPPVKATPPPPPRQSAFHSQFVSQMEGKSVEQQFVDPSRGGSNDVDTNGNAELESRLAVLDLKEKPDTKKYYSRDTVDVSNELDSNANAVRGLININARNGITFHKDISLKKSDSPPPLPNVEPPSDDDLDKSMKLKTIYVQNVSDKNNNGGGGSDSKESSCIHQIAINDRLMSDLSQDSSSSDTSSAENNYFVSSNRRIELPPAYLFPESGNPPRDLVASNAEKDVDIILNLKSADQLNVDASENDKTSPSSLSPDSEHSAEKINAFNETKQCSDDIKKIKKGNLKNTNSANNKRRVSFDPLALLLDASLEGELELVVRTAGQVKNPSAANDEGITALHNAICAGHFEIVKFLVQFGCDVNAQDSDGWTPLHCAASCNNLPMVRFLVEHGACIFATTLSDQETAAEKCEEDEEGFDGCSEFLYSVQEKLGILNNGAVYAVFDYEAHNPDELSFKEGDRLTVLRKGDEWEREWWWSRLHDKEGYIPRNLLGLYPRIHGNTNKVQD